MMKRRPNYSGSVRQVSENKYVAEITIGVKENGKPNKKQFSARTRAEATRKLNEYKKTLNLEAPQQVRKKTVNEYFEFWLGIKKVELKSSSYRRLESTFETYIKPQFGRLQFASVRTEDVQGLINRNQIEKSYSTIKKIYDCLNAVFKYDQSLPPQQRVASYNPCTNVVFRNGQDAKVEVKVYSEDEIKKIKLEINRKMKNGKLVYPYGKLFILILNTGMRIGEALALDKSDIDFKRKTIAITKNMTLGNKDNGYQSSVMNTTKTSAGRRTISMNAAAVSAAKDLFEAFPETSALVVNKNGKRVSLQNAEKTFKQILSSANVDANGRSCHALRHTFATRMFEAKRDPKVVSHMLGHRSVSTTYDIYVSVLQRIEAQELEDIPDI
jgi:integrase